MTNIVRYRTDAEYLQASPDAAVHVMLKHPVAMAPTYMAPGVTYCGIRLYVGALWHRVDRTATCRKCAAKAAAGAIR